MDITVYSNKGERTLIWGQIYPQGPGFTASVQSILQLVNQFKNCSQICHVSSPWQFVPTDFNDSIRGDQKQPETLHSFKVIIVTLPGHPELSCNTVFLPSYLLYIWLFVQQVWQLQIREGEGTVSYSLS